MNFKENDKLNRERFAEFLIEIITNNKKYKRESDTKSFVLAIDSSWGTGKTTFFNMLEDKMNNKEDANYTIINYNAWKSDAWENPFETLMCAILNHKVFNETDDVSNLKNLGKDLIKISKEIGKGIIKKQASKIISEEVIDTIEREMFSSGDYQNAIKNRSTSYDFFKEYEQYDNNIEKMKKSLQVICNKTNLVIFIDELDRCKPTFAIKLLETVKHLFDVEGLTFVFALDIKQLSFSVQSVYGSGIDATGYLCRFFDYISKLPKPDIKKYIESLLKQNKLINPNLTLDSVYNNTSFVISFEDTFKMLADIYNLSLRDINTIYANFLIFEKLELSEVTNLEIYQIYLTFIIMKYKYSNCFDKVFVKKTDITDETFIKGLQKIENKYKFKNLVETIIHSTKNINEIKDEYGYKIAEVLEENIKFVAEDYFPTRKVLDKNKTYLNYFTYNDLVRWKEIKDLTLKEFIHRKLEMFDFSWKDELEEVEGE